MKRLSRIGERWSGAVCGLLLLAGVVLLLPMVSSAQDTRVLRLESVVIAPDDPSTIDLVRRYLTIGVGDPVDQDVLARVREDLEASGYFRDVILYTARGTAPGDIVLHVEVTLDRKIRFLTGFGHHPLDGWFLNLVGARLMNQPRPGAELRVALRNGYFVDGFYVEGRFPAGERIGDAWLVELNAENRTWFAYDQREPWTQIVKSVALRVGRRRTVSPRVQVTGWLGSFAVKPERELTAFFEEEDQHRPAAELIADEFDELKFLELRLEAAWDARPSQRAWHEGAWGGARLRASHDFEATTFFTAEIDGRRTVPLGTDVAVAGRVRAAHASSETPYHQRFSFGGGYSVRGFDIAYLSGPLGARDLVQANLELRGALLDRDAATPKLTGVLFVDLGQSWGLGGDSAGLAAGAGFGFRLRLPWVHLVGVEVSYPLTDLGEISPFVLNMALGWSY